MSSLSSRLAPKRQLRLTAAATVLLILFFLALLVSSCEARRLRARGMASLRNSPPDVPWKDVANLNVDGSPTKQTKDLSNVDTHTTVDYHMARGDAKVKEGVAMASPGAVRTTIVVRVSQRLSHPEQGEGTGFHLDYAGPRTHPPSHN